MEKDTKIKIANVVIIALVCIGVVLLVYLYESGFRFGIVPMRREPEFITINSDSYSEKDSFGNERLFHVTLEVYNKGGDGWGYIVACYKENGMLVEEKSWQIYLDSQESEIINFVFERESEEIIQVEVEWSYRYG